VAAGKVRYVGVSNFTGWQLQRAALLGCRPGHARVVTLQPQYSLLVREIEWELVPLCLAEGVGMLPWSPLGGGWLTGKYSRDERPSGATRLGEDPGRGQEAWDKRNTERTWAVVDAVREIADAHGASMAQVALAWVTGRPGVTSTILGTRTVEQLDDNLGAARLELEPEQVDRLDEVSDPGLPPYPYGFIEEMSRERAELRG
jgi:aryl-alcohol dehydrogenase-like predicted oxidoreductase